MLEVKQLCPGTDRIDGQTNGRIALFQNAPPPRAGHNKATWRSLTLLRFWLPLVHVLSLPSEGRHTRLALEVSVPKVSFCRPAVAHLKNRPTYAAKVRSRRIGCRYFHSRIVHPCHIVPICPLLHCPLPQIQRSRRIHYVSAWNRMSTRDEYLCECMLNKYATRRGGVSQTFRSVSLNENAVNKYATLFYAYHLRCSVGFLSCGILRHVASCCGESDATHPARRRAVPHFRCGRTLTLPF